MPAALKIASAFFAAAVCSEAYRVKHRRSSDRRVNATGALEAEGSHFVFLEVYSIGGMSRSSIPTLSGEEPAAAEEDSAPENYIEFYHSELLICNRSAFSPVEQVELMSRLGSDDYTYLEDSWWESRDKRCALLAYGGSSNGATCSGTTLLDQLLSERYSPIRNAQTDHAWKYFYGAGDMSSEGVQRAMCQHSLGRPSECGANWAGASYNLLRNNCNTFAATGMQCVLGLSGSLPNLGFSTGGGPKCSICP